MCSAAHSRRAATGGRACACQRAASWLQRIAAKESSPVIKLDCGLRKVAQQNELGRARRGPEVESEQNQKQLKKEHACVRQQQWNSKQIQPKINTTTNHAARLNNNNISKQIQQIYGIFQLNRLSVGDTRWTLLCETTTYCIDFTKTHFKTSHRDHRRFY
jgi:nitric oxide reductase activation protein